MSNVVLAFPVVPGKSAKSISEMLKSRPSEYRESRSAAGIELERAYHQQTPMGDFVVLYIESKGSALEALASGGTSDLAIDKELVGLVKEIHGVDLTAPPPGPAPETLASWSDPQVTERRSGFAFTAPLLPGRVDAGRTFAKEAWGTKVDEVTASRRALGLTREVVTLQPTPNGDVICVYLEGYDPAAGNRAFAASDAPYDRWFKKQLATLFIPEIDFDKPVPGVTEIFDSAGLLITR